MIKVLQYGLTSHLGGIETYLYKLYKHIDKTKYRFDFLILEEEKDVCFHKEFKEFGSEFFSITPRAKNPIKNSLEIKSVLKKGNYDLIHCNMNSLSYSEPIFTGLKQDVPVLVHSRNANPPSSKITQILHLINSKKLNQKNVTRIAVSDLAGKWMFGDSVLFQTINNGLDVNKYKFSSSARKLKRKELGISHEDLTIVNVGAFREQKNHRFIIKVFSEVIKKKVNSKLVLVGEGNLMDDVKNYANELGILKNIQFLGNRKDISEVLSASDVFLFPSFYEGFPNAVLEAQTSGLPCLIANTITKEIIINKNVYHYSLEKNEKEWAEKIMNIYHEEKDSAERINFANDIVNKGFSVDSEVERICKIYDRLAHT
ncbi:glycosyltransferase [Rossellomorea marisflavi]|uniref:glycosyltransferase n=1 Tax=Rossellomorea marisflavi TaxID=189381 RepID=UPI00345B05C2